MQIKELKNTDAISLSRFFSELDDDVYKKWNRLGFRVKDIDARKAAEKQCSIPEKEEKGFVAVAENGEIIGYSYLRLFPEKPVKKHVASLGIVISQKHHSKGIGRKLMQYMHEWAERNGIKKIWLGTYSSNKNALALYKKYGYKVEGVFMYEELFDTGWEHVVSMAKFIGSEIKEPEKQRKTIIDGLYAQQ